jgi:hypothetical protein
VSQIETPAGARSRQIIAFCVEAALTRTPVGYGIAPRFC